MSEIETLLDCEDALYEIAQAQVILDLARVEIAKRYGTLGGRGNKAIEDVGYILDLYLDKEVRKRLEKISEVMARVRESSPEDLEEIKARLNRQIEES